MPSSAGPSSLTATLTASAPWLACWPACAPARANGCSAFPVTARACRATWPARLAGACTEARADLAYAVCEAQAQPVFCLLRRHLADSAAQFLAEGGRKLERWQQMQAHCALHFDQPGDAAAFININSLSELQGLSHENPESPNHA